ncbi:MAG: hypothetical protein IPM16_00280 [Chloroflexi bacterium]|nr:hypothetical protein [Chloroflexota bacterium]
MWVYAEYEATALFTLKPAGATSSGGKTLLVPTPYSIKMALLDITCRLDGADSAEAFWPVLAQAIVAIRPPDEVVVNNTFAKVLRQRRNEAALGEQHAGFFGKTIAYREYAYFAGTIGLAVETSTADEAERIARWMVNINYLGKRGGFIQIQDWPESGDTLPDGYLPITGDLTGMAMDSVLTQLDDTDERVGFGKVNIYTTDRITLGKERVLKHVALPYRRVGSSRSYTHYRRHDE